VLKLKACRAISSFLIGNTDTRPNEFLDE